MTSSSQSRTTRVRITMERPFRTFGPKLRQGFLEDLATLVGVTVEEIQDVSFVRGCVMFDGDLPWAAAIRLDELTGSTSTKPASEQQALGDFMITHHITRIVVGRGHNLLVVRRPPGGRPGKDLVFVHGWRGDSESFGLLPQWLSEDFKCRPLVYPYPTGVGQHSPSLVFLARNLDNWLRNQELASRYAIIAHSYGGLVSRKFLVLQASRREPLDDGLARIIFVASPHQGSTFAKAGKLVSWLNSEQLQELSGDSPILFELNEEWQNWIALNGAGIARSVFGTADKIVDAASAQGLDPEAIPIAGANHTEIVRPKFRTDEVVKTMRRLLTEAGFGEEEEEQKRFAGEQRL